MFGLWVIQSLGVCFSMSNSLAAELRESCHTADENAVKQFLKDGADPNDCDKVSAWHMAMD